MRCESDCEVTPQSAPSSRVAADHVLAPGSRSLVVGRRPSAVGRRPSAVGRRCRGVFRAARCLLAIYSTEHMRHGHRHRPCSIHRPTSRPTSTTHILLLHMQMHLN